MVRCATPLIAASNKEANLSSLIVRGGRPLHGRITPSANKNAVLPILCATLLTDEPVTLRGVPDITDVQQILGLFQALGSEVDWDKANRILRLSHANISGAAASLPDGMRSSIMLIPPLIARFGETRLEGEVKGCTLGAREIDPHIEVFQTFGVDVSEEATALVMSLRRAIPRCDPLARLCLGDHHREFRPVRRQGEGGVRADQRRLRAARAGVLRLPDLDGRAHTRGWRQPPAGRRRRAPGRGRLRASPRISTRSPPSWLWAPLPVARSR